MLMDTATGIRPPVMTWQFHKVVLRQAKGLGTLTGDDTMGDRCASDVATTRAVTSIPCVREIGTPLEGRKGGPGGAKTFIHSKNPYSYEVCTRGFSSRYQISPTPWAWTID